MHQQDTERDEAMRIASQLAPNAARAVLAPLRRHDTPDEGELRDEGRWLLDNLAGRGLAEALEALRQAAEHHEPELAPGWMLALALERADEQTLAEATQAMRCVGGRT